MKLKKKKILNVHIVEPKQTEPLNLHLQEGKTKIMYREDFSPKAMLYVIYN